MPSVGSISATTNRNYHNQYHIQSIMTSFPLIDPLDAFYLLNPSGDLNYTQNEFETWFRDQNLEGKAGCAPPAEELAVALKSHDLFMYIGHGCGMFRFYILLMCCCMYTVTSGTIILHNRFPNHPFLNFHFVYVLWYRATIIQYIPRLEIQRLEHCASTLLMGCSCGSLKLNGCYVPQGTPLSYLLAGSPVILLILTDLQIPCLILG
ncbi:putative separase [Rosa chinensis]|uniref:separase n=1 Tax=Rosa chinensis TaxID=74649 RepID=A0A2P6PDN4_ROSCH|nr:putative separase [Rosa chinensis]